LEEISDSVLWEDAKKGHPEDDEAQISQEAQAEGPGIRVQGREISRSLKRRETQEAQEVGPKNCLWKPKRDHSEE